MDREAIGPSAGGAILARMSRPGRRRRRRLRAMNTSLHAPIPRSPRSPRRAPLLVDVVPAGEVVPAPRRGRRLPRRPADRTRPRCARRCAPRSASRWRWRAAPATPTTALALARRAARSRCMPNHDLGGVGPMSGAVTGSMPVLVARDEATGLTAWCPLNEGSGKVLRYGADDEEVVARLRVDARRAGPGTRARARASTGPLDLIELQRAALQLGDECHHRTEAGTELLARRCSRRSCRTTSPPSSRGNGQFFLNVGDGLGQARAGLRRRRAGLVARDRRSRATASRSAIKLSGTGDAWFIGPAALPDPAALYDGYAAEDMNPDLGDSRDRRGLRPRRAGASAGSPLSAPSVGLDPADADAIDGSACARSPPASTRVCAWPSRRRRRPRSSASTRARVVATGIRPPVHTGIAHRAAGRRADRRRRHASAVGGLHAAVAALDAAAGRRADGDALGTGARRLRRPSASTRELRDAAAARASCRPGERLVEQQLAARVRDEPHARARGAAPAGGRRPPRARPGRRLRPRRAERPLDARALRRAPRAGGAVARGARRPAATAARSRRSEQDWRALEARAARPEALPHGPDFVHADEALPRAHRAAPAATTSPRAMLARPQRPHPHPAHPRLHDRRPHRRDDRRAPRDHRAASSPATPTPPPPSCARTSSAARWSCASASARRWRGCSRCPASRPAVERRKGAGDRCRRQPPGFGSAVDEQRGDGVAVGGVAVVGGVGVGR